jgi:hypothetical protein
MERHDKTVQEYTHDPYYLKEKYSEPSICDKCNVVFNHGIFQWLDAPPKGARKIICPACRRIEDQYEGGLVLLEGQFLAEHKQEILNIIYNTEEAEKRYRPLERIMEIKDQGNRVEITTTYEHIARRIGEAVQRAYKGELRLQYPESEKYIRVYWKRL